VLVDEFHRAGPPRAWNVCVDDLRGGLSPDDHFGRLHRWESALVGEDIEDHGFPSREPPWDPPDAED
jgi:hypothetical protein